jgi:hypothetical protein
MVTDELVLTKTVLTGNVPDVAPAAMVIDTGTVAAEVVPDVSVTVRPPVGAGPLIVTVPVEDVPA